MINFKWQVDLQGMVGAWCTIETTEGSLREGRVSAIKAGTLRCAQGDGRTREYTVPIGIELNNDSTDVIEFVRMASLVLA